MFYLPKGSTTLLVEEFDIWKSWPKDVSIQCPSTQDFDLDPKKVSMHAMKDIDTQILKKYKIP